MDEQNMGTNPNGNGQNVQEVFTQEDIDKNKTMAGLAYLIFFLPLIACPDSAFGKFHANQGLLLLIVNIAGNIAFGIILSFIPFIGWTLRSLFGLAIIIFFILGLINGLNGKAVELPIIGKYRLIK